MSICLDCQGKEIKLQEAAKQGVCDVCRITKKDRTIKQVWYCKVCDANLCKECEPRYDKRMVAMIVQAFNFKTNGSS